MWEDRGKSAKKKETSEEDRTQAEAELQLVHFLLEEMYEQVIKTQVLRLVQCPECNYRGGAQMTITNDSTEKGA